ncbi:MAG TPA: lipopolysaccharide heptosyltransferase II [Ktedonobacterales bacterium]|nr:lipopolysaccharide heptosyltransferase II [Ktedonobacterales bacterium]
MGMVGYDIRPAFAQRTRTFLIHRLIKPALQGVIYVSLGAVGLLSRLVRIGRAMPPLTPATFAPKRILIIRTDLMGDVILSLPAVHALHRAYPAAHIDMLVLPANVGVIKQDSAISRIMTYDPNIWRRPNAFLSPVSYRAFLGLIGGLRAAQYDLCLSLAGDWASVFAFLSKARRRVGYRGEAYPFFMTDPVPGRRYRIHQHEVDYIAGLARAAGGMLKGEQREPALAVSEQARAEVKALLGVNDVAEGDLLIAAHAGATNGVAKRWPIPHWAALADQLITELGAKVVLTGAASDAEITGAIAAQMRQTPLDFAGKTTIPQLAALLERCDLVISGDSGPLHMAGAVGTPVIAIHGPTDPELSGPVGKDATVLRLGIWCSPCYDASFWAVCRFFNPVCMKAITPEQVLAAARARLERPTSANDQAALAQQR